ncbi:hypothetical protein NST45_18850 [Paenibacillus sp. FSL R7-0163]|uniref:hypothetical protein n=1 Tax=Paenibacillus TaxID=44249 RepID=UPI00096D70C0|nr:hypothetical protein [Paenibacillus odorifer]OME40955.1 hypothetical protein BSK58_15890 [Paenibacillus odorifer]
MKKSIWLSIVTIFLFQSIASSVFSEESVNDTSNNLPKTATAVIEKINKDMAELYKKSNYYTMETNKGKLREDLLQNQIKSNNSNFEIVYGGNHEWLEHSNMFAFSGYSIDGDSVSTEGAPWYAGWSGIQIQNFNMIKEPWKDSGVKSSYKIRKNDFDAFVGRDIEYLANSGGTFEQAILTGLNLSYAGKKYERFIYNNQDKEYKDRVVYTQNTTPSKGGRWIDYVHVLQPPTYLSWGSGRIYIQGSNGNITYLGIPIAPFILQVNDLSPHFETLPTGAVAGQEVTVGIRLRSSFATQKTTDYAWKITSNGKEIPVRYHGHASTLAGEIMLAANTADNILFATFTMPDEDVYIQFNLNRLKSPNEVFYGNNEIYGWIKKINSMPTTKGSFDLDYNVLSKKVKFGLADGAAIKAVLQPQYSDFTWSGNATGALEVINNSDTIYRYFRVENNPLVNDAASTIVRQPDIIASLQRPDFGDDPVNGKWYINPAPYTPNQKSGNISFQGTVSRNFTRNYQVCSTTKNGQGKDVESCQTYTESGSTSAPFTPGEDVKTIRTYIYNGAKQIAPKLYKNSIDKNKADSLIRKLLWTSEPYNYNVIRWMAHEDENKNLQDWTKVKGQFERIFTQQASGDIGWKVENSMAQAYKKARATAKKMLNDKSNYDTAVFATDKQLQGYDYPIKSGYYFNPVGTYTFTLETVTFKDTDKDTKDHKDLVEELTNSFRYETDLMYINNDKVAVNLRNEPLSKNGNNFARKPAALSVEDNTGVNDAKLLTVENSFTKDVEEIPYSQERESDNGTHEFWKNILEGYSQSSTLGSFDNFKYREYVGLNQNMYKITEKSTVTITINKDHIPVYTTAEMPDGKYYVKAWLADVELSKSTNAYKSLGKLVGIKPLDQIEVTVKGSMFDDLNN